jgi:hypothetical protein
MKGAKHIERIYVVTAIDTDTNDHIQYEESSLTKARVIADSLKSDPDVTNITILEYNTVSKQYHMIND